MPTNSIETNQMVSEQTDNPATNSQNIETPTIKVEPIDEPTKQIKQPSKRQLKRMRRKANFRRRNQQERRDKIQQQNQLIGPQSPYFQEPIRHRSTSVQPDRKFCFMINYSHDQNVTPKSSKLDRPPRVSRTQAIMGNPVNSSAIATLPIEQQQAAWNQTIQTAPSSAEMNEIQCQYENGSLESTSTQSEVCYILPGTFQDQTLLRASLDTQVYGYKERKKQRNR